MANMIATERLFLTEGRDRLVPEGDEAAATLYCAPGDEIPESAVEQFGLKDGGLPENKGGKKPENKGGKKPKNKGGDAGAAGVSGAGNAADAAGGAGVAGDAAASGDAGAAGAAAGAQA